MKYTVNFTDENGATTAIDTITAPVEYTAEEYIEACKQNEEWSEILKNGSVELIPAEYYIADGPEADSIYGEQNTYCMSEEEVRSLSKEWETDLFQVMREATKEDIKKYGVCDE